MGRQTRWCFYSLLSLLLFPHLLQARTNVALIEFAAFNLTPADINLKKDLEQVVLRTLNKSVRIRPEFISADRRLLVPRGKEASVLSQAGFEYVVRGEFTNFPDDQIGATVWLSRIKGGVESLSYAHQRSRLPKKVAFSILDRWFRHLAGRFVGTIENSPMRQVVYASCFDSFDGQDPDMDSLEAILSVKLKNALRGGILNSRYEVLGFETLGDFEVACNFADRSYLSIYDYVILGDIKRHKTRGKIVVGVSIRVGEESTFVGDVIRSSDPTLLVGELARFISEKWDSIILH